MAMGPKRTLYVPLLAYAYVASPRVRELNWLPILEACLHQRAVASCGNFYFVLF